MIRVSASVHESFFTREPLLYDCEEYVQEEDGDCPSVCP